MLRIHKSDNELKLIKDCQKGLGKAQKDLYHRLAGKMLGLCYRYLQDKTEAEHVMIGGMVKVFEKIKQYSGEGNFEGWVRRIMVNESLMYLRKNGAMSLMLDIDSMKDELDFGSLEDTLQQEDLLKLIHELPVGYRTVFNLYAIEGYSHAEIADSMQISENTSKSQLSRARKYLQHRLKELENKELKKENGNFK